MLMILKILKYIINIFDDKLNFFFPFFIHPSDNNLSASLVSNDR